MPDVERLTFKGSVGYLYRDDGSVVTMVPTVQNQWIPENGKQYPLPPPAAPGATISITAEMVEAAVTSVGGSVSAMLDTSANIAAAFNDAVAGSYPDILSTKNRVACLVGECAQETDWYKTTVEYTAGSNSYSPYDGRGFIQLTYQSNYAAFGKWMQSIGRLTDANYFVDNPTALGDVKYAAYTAIYYFTQVLWSGQNLMQLCDASATPWHDISRAINRGDPASTDPAYGEADRTTAIDAVLGVTPDPTTPPAPTGLQDAVVAWVEAREGSFRYSQASPQRLDPDSSGQTDCSALMGRCYLDVTGKHIGWWTGSHDDGQQQYGSVVVEGGSGSSPDESLLVKGDLIFFNWSGPNPDYDHVDMYVGANEVSGHGGPGMGPTRKTMNTRCAAAYNWRVRRYI
jgi:predicted chitinase